MCTSLFLLDAHPTLLLLLLFNRDEFYGRPTDPAHFWVDNPDILAGRDAMRGGTWMGVTRSGRWAFLTNYREPISPPPGAADASSFPQTTNAPSRGALTTDFLASDVEPLEYLQSLRKDYMGVSVAVGDLRSGKAAFHCNRDGSPPRELTGGTHGVSNGFLGKWPKVEQGMEQLKKIIEEADLESGDLPWDQLFGPELMGDPTTVEDPAMVPITGVGEELDRKLSARFVMPFEMTPGQHYGTRSQTIVAVWRDGRVEYRERFFKERVHQHETLDATAPASALQDGACEGDCVQECQLGAKTSAAEVASSGSVAPECVCGEKQQEQQQQQQQWNTDLRALLAQCSCSVWAAGKEKDASTRASSVSTNAGLDAGAGDASSTASGSSGPVVQQVTAAGPESCGPESCAGQSNGHCGIGSEKCAQPQQQQQQQQQHDSEAPPRPSALETLPSPGPGGPGDEWHMVQHVFHVPITRSKA